MRSLKEKGWKPVSNDAFEQNLQHLQMFANLTFFQKGINPSIQHSPLTFAIFTICASLFQFFICQQY